MTENQLPNPLKGGASAGLTLPIIGSRRVAVTVLMVVLTVAIFVLDCLTPLGYAIWLLYFIPLMLTTSELRLNPYMLAVVFTILIVTGFFMSPPGVILSVSIFNRSLGVFIIWIKAVMLARQIQVKEVIENYRTLYESMDQGFCVIEMVYDQNGKPVDYRFTDINPAFEEQTGFQQALGKTILQLQPDIETHWLDFYGKVAQTGEAIRYENVAIGMHKYFDVFAFRIDGEGSKKVGVLFKDITKNKELLNQLQDKSNNLIESQKQLLSFIKSAPVSIAIFDKNMNYLAASYQWVNDYGKDYAELVGRNHYELHPDLPSDWKGFHQEGLAGATFTNKEDMWTQADGTKHWLRWSLQPWYDENHMIGGIVISAYDISASKHAEQTLLDINDDLIRSMTEAEKANLAKSDFLAHMSHELRTPLNAILGFAQLLEAGKPSPTDIQAIRLNQIIKSGWYLLNLINEILDLAMIESGKMSISLKTISLSMILSECQSMLEPQAQKSDINLIFLLPDSTWYVHADQIKLKQVLINLLSNAIKYNKANGNVKVWCSESTLGRIRITIKDDGSGISMEEMKNLFQPFNRFGHEVGTKEGAGIGLAVTKKLVEMMGGTIGLESTVAEGSEFWIELDREVISQPTALIGFPDEFVSHHKDDAAGYTMLYVEDNPSSLLLVEHIIGDYPHIRMLSALDGTSAIAITKEHLPDIILMDINLSGISGIETMALLREDSVTKHIPIIALSANAMLADINYGMEVGFSSYVTKPIKNTELLEALDAVIATKRKEQESAKIQ
jgi:PAS domain S-box-containing protein